MTRAVEILLVEDNPGDVRLTREALADGKLANNLHVATDGAAALEFLRRASSPRPDLVLLDLNLPKISGWEVLAEMKADPRLCTIPVVVLTTSEDEADVMASYRLHANCYITKPVDFHKFTTVVQSIEQFWFAVVRLPPDREAE